MQIKQLFRKNIARPINGVVKADQTENETVFVELDEYVITNELREHIENFFKFFMPSVHDPEQAAIAGKSGIWVSGFFGSGKSHFIKILSYLLQNIEATNGNVSKHAFEFFEEKIQGDAMLMGDINAAIQKKNKVILFNIDSRADTDDKEDAILKVFLKVFNEQLGYSGDHAHIAHLERDLDSRGQFDAFKTAFENSAGASWLKQRDSFDFYRDDIAYALSKVTGQSEDATRQWVEKLEENFPLDIANFCKWVKEYLDVDPDRRLLFFVDEVGQFIGQNTQMMLKLQTITENLGTICNGRAWVIVTSQEDIDAVLGRMQGSKSQDFSKIQARFERISLSSSNTNEVIEKRLLDKTPEAKVELAKLYDTKGDIIRNQLSFEKSNNAELANYTDTESFVNSYPFIPFHYNLVQKIFTGISRAGATGAHMARGERSLIEAFQTSISKYLEQNTGQLIPVYSFYSSIKKFLDTAVVRDINQAAEKSSINDFSVNVLQALFMLRYVDEVKSTIDNLVTLCITEVDQDKRDLRLKIEDSLNVLERNVLISRQGDEYIFLTNEEKEIEKEIQNTDIEASDETTELSTIIFEEILRRENNFRYPENKQDFPVSRFCNGQPFDRNVESDLLLRIVSPIDASYENYTHAACGNYSSDCILVKLADKPAVFDELRTFIKTAKFVRKTSGNTGAEQEQRIRLKANENSTRRKRLVLEIEELLKTADYYTLGSGHDAKGGSVKGMLDNAYRYVIENTFSKLKQIKPFAGSNILQEIQQTLVADDIAQIGLNLDDAEVNPLAIMDVQGFISLSDDHSKSITAGDVLKRYAKSPYGWNNDEIILLLARLALANKIIFQANQQDVPLKSAYEHLSKTAKCANLRIRKIKQQSDANLKRANRLFKDVFMTTAPSGEKELFNTAIEKFALWQGKLRNFKAKSSTGQYPGIREIEDGITLIASLTEVKTSFQFIELFLSQANDLLDFEEEYQDLETFYETQFTIWQNLYSALYIDFASNRSFLDKSPEASDALGKLNAIYNNPRPYKAIRNVQPLIEKVAKLNKELITGRREFVRGKLEACIVEVTQHINEANAPDDVSNQALRPLQAAIANIEKQNSISVILHEQREGDVHVLDAETLINAFIAKQVKEAELKAQIEAQKEAQQASANSAADGGSSYTTTITAKPAVIAEPLPKMVMTLNTSDVYNQLNGSAHIETEADIEKYVSELKTQLLKLIASNHKVRIR
ncbi:MAG: BREX system P-loop protein BrxC [Saccharospirillaceae bacterium]|nr:BREX system P-loop protein BrxC [Saccharospirillaceae bacterium]